MDNKVEPVDGNRTLSNENQLGEESKKRKRQKLIAIGAAVAGTVALAVIIGVVIATGGKEPADPDDCESNPCNNDGTCSDGVNSYTCDCQYGFTGDHCELDSCDVNPCQNEGVCHLNDVNGYNCECLPGYEGVNCENEINECLPTSCQNEGTCVDGINTYICNCTDGFGGVNCEIDFDECESDPCYNNATCLDGINTYTCDCLPGYSGDRCLNNTNECYSSPCANNGICIDDINRYTCDCVQPFRGEHCETMFPGIYIGCFNDVSSQRALNVFSETTNNAYMTVEKCLQICSTIQFALGEPVFYAGVQFGYECFCGTTYDMHGEADESGCDMPCTGSDEQICGAVIHNSVYQTIPGVYAVVQCGESTSITAGESVVVISLNHPNVYTDNLECLYTVTALDDALLYFRFNVLRLETGGYDEVHINDNFVYTDTTDISEEIASEASTLNIRFTTDFSITAAGFQLVVHAR